MSEKTDKRNWITSAADIKMDDIDKQLYINGSIEDFLQNKFFIIAEKGIGKTLLLKKKKYDLLQKKQAYFIPSSHDLDIPASFGNLSYKEIYFLEKIENTSSLWSLSIQLSSIKKYYYDEEVKPKPDKNKLPDTFNNILESQREYSTPSEIFHYLINDVPQTLHYIKSYFSIINTLYNDIRFSIYIFIDRLDQAMIYNSTQEMWITMQTGLLEAAWNLNEYNQHIKIYCSIRKEAYIEYRSEIKANLSGQVCFLHYRKDELHKLVNKLSKYYEQGKTIEDIVGFGKFIHCKTDNEETVFDYILRHTVAKPRDLIRIASTLRKNITPKSEIKIKIEELRNSTNEAAAKVAEDIFTEKSRFLDCLQDENEKNRFLSLIPKNTLCQKSIIKICSEFNKRPLNECSKEQCLKHKEVNGCKHPFCELNNIGLFGYVNTDIPIKQIFKDSDTDAYTDSEKANHLTGCYSYYIVHPSLCESISKLRHQKGGKYMVTPGITTGNGYDWNERDAEISLLIDNVLNAELPEENEKQIIKDLKDTIKVTEDIKKLIKKTMNKIDATIIKKKIFLSYCGKDEATVNSIDENLKLLGLKVTRDNRDLHFKANVKNFMQSLKKHGYIITVVSKSYLKSKNCMFEIGQLLKMDDYKSKTLQIILPDADIFDDNKYQYIEFWESEIKRVEKKLKKNTKNNNNMSLINEDIKDYNDIAANLPDFLKFVITEKGMLLSDLENKGYKTLLDIINKKKE
ncbi:MAG: toll/interleukin-1 receptor domain-containing protein [Treponema sp.]|nr:toll/interleukin-1 receptor domain-containing protein [Treponema sp.]